jgi:hypothetical protein
MSGDTVSRYPRSELEAENARLVAENQRLRDALERIGDDRDPLNGYRGAGDFARSTLAGTPNEDTR